MVLSQVINGSLLPMVLLFILILINDRKIMGKYTNGKLFNLIAWSLEHNHYHEHPHCALSGYDHLSEIEAIKRAI
jgi:hypothetical protein